MMIQFWFLIWLSIGLSWGDQYYDETLCSSGVNLPGTRYTCSSSPQECQTFLVYRADEKFQTIANISSLFNVTPEELLAKNNAISSSSQILEPGMEVLVPIVCSCIEQFYEANVNYIFPGSMTLVNVSCGVFEGLLKSITLIEANPSANTTLQVGSMLQIPLKCACPEKLSSNVGVRYLVTYPFIENDNPNKVSKKFSIPVGDLLEANHLDPLATVYPQTTILVPLKSEPSIIYDVPASEPPNSPGFVPTEPVRRRNKSTQLKRVYISVSVVGFVLVLVTLIACGLYVKALKKCKAENLNSFARRSPMTSCSTPRSSQLSGPTPAKSSNASCLSPDLLESIRYSLGNYSVEELKKATNDFSEETRLMDDVYKGIVDDSEILIKRTRFEDTRQVIEIHSKINHVNIVKLHGVCYGENDFSWSYLVFEFPGKGSLRRCLSSSDPSLRWNRRTQIAFDVATGLHYLHYCMVPPYTHMHVNSKNIFLTRSWRAKIAVYGGSMPPIGSSNDHESITSTGGWGVSSEHLVHGSVSENEDIFAFGIVLLELISAKEDLDGQSLIESTAFLGGGASDQGGCFNHLRNFVDPNLKEEYPLAEALCLAVLAKACIEDDPPHRPSMDDILKVLARMV
ncbi:lysM domain receptor-like kinase 4 [Coffea eugenioides]|uniref:lysM domain receptor-like kinase 4 n=1 Tax=Coffea eugenioides TaxID=49369 RepID=UPI000F611A43|nr:lysM domain receptor-like kinase 4 [Coffea eugenioides]